MKNKNILAVLGMVAVLGLAGCGRNSGDASDAPASSATASEPASEASSVAASDKNSSAAVDTTADADKVIEGLDISKSTNASLTDKDGVEITNIANGYYEDGAAYGWVRYENKWSAGHFYGAAVKLSFNAEAQVSDVVVGVPVDGYVNFTESYRTNANGAAAFEKYKTITADMKTALSGKTAAEIIKATGTATADGTNFEHGDYTFVGTGGTQTDSRLAVALQQAAKARFLAVEKTTAVDPFATKFAALTVTPDASATGNIHGGKVEDGAAYGYDYYSSYGHFYGCAVKLTIGADDKITAVELGQPTAEGSDFVNFTEMYIAQNTYAYVNYLEVAPKITAALVGQTVNEAFVTTYSAAVADPTVGDWGTFTPATTFVGAGATQTDSRIGVAICDAAQAYLNSKAAA